MKKASNSLLTALQQGDALYIRPRLIAEWDYNRFYSPTVTVTPSQSGVDGHMPSDAPGAVNGGSLSIASWVGAFGDVNSMTLPDRPTAGIAKARTDSDVVPQRSFQTSPGQTRYYPTSETDTYRYFSSVDVTQLTGTGGAFAFPTPVQVVANYGQTIAVNKIVVGFEKGYSTPKSITIETSVDGAHWVTAMVNPTIAADGTATIWHNDGGWGEIPIYDSVVGIHAVRLTIRSMDRPYAHVDILQISPRLENDLSDFLVSYDTDFEVSSPSFIAPMGKASSNQASVTLSNIDGRFNTNNTQSLYYGMIEKKVKFTLDLGVDTTNFGGQKYEYVREFTMWTDAWGGQDSTSVKVDLKDSSVILQEQTMPPMVLTNATVGQIVWQTMDMVGMTNYHHTLAEDDFGYVIPYYWPSDTAEKSNPRWGRLQVSTTPPPTSTIWDEFAALAESTQTAIYFDEYDVMQIVGRKAMFRAGATPSWNLDAIKNGNKLPDIVSTTTDYNLATNRVEVTYKPAAYAADNNGLSKMEVVWQYSQPTDPTVIVPTADNNSTDVVLRAAAIVRDCHAGDTEVWISQVNAAYWPWESDINIEGELLHYLGKEYIYYDDKAIGPQRTVVTNLTQQQSLDTLSALNSYKNAYSGRLVVTQRGLYGTAASDHYITTGDYTSLLTSYDNSVFQPLTGHVTQNTGYITQYNAVTPDANNASWLGNHNPWDQTYHLRKNGTEVVPQAGGQTVWYGAKIRFPSTPVTLTANWKVGGLFFAGDWGDAGYYLEISSTNQIEFESRRNRHEISLVGMPGNAHAIQIAGTNKDVKGFQVAIVEGAWTQIDLSYTMRNGDNTVLIAVYKDGVLVGNWIIPRAQQPSYVSQGRFGTHVRGPSSMDIEYLYAAGQDDQNPFHSPEQTSFLDIVSGGYASGFVSRNIKYNFIDINPGWSWPSGYVEFPQRLSQAYCSLDEFGPIVHEVRKFDAQFNTQYVPVSSSYLYNTNPYVDQLYYFSDAFGAEFMIANASRENVVANGTQTISANDSVNHTMMVYGRCIYQAQSDNYLIKADDAAIRRQGLIRTQLTSRYIQTKEMADEIGQWIVDLWAMGVDEVSVDTFGNPLLNLGDLVTINYPVKGMYPTTHKYFVVSVKNTFENGYKTSLTLRRAKV